MNFVKACRPKTAWQRLTRRLGRLVHDLPWWFLHRFHPRHRHHIVHTGLRPGWIDRDYLMAHLVVKVFLDFVEQEQPFEHFVTSGPESNDAEGWAEVRRLYDYFKGVSVDEVDYDTLTEMLKRVIEVRRHYWT